MIVQYPKNFSKAAMAFLKKTNVFNISQRCLMYVIYIILWMSHLLLIKFSRHVEMICDEVKLWENANFENPYVEKALKQNANFAQLKKTSSRGR